MEHRRIKKREGFRLNVTEVVLAFSLVANGVLLVALINEEKRDVAEAERILYSSLETIQANLATIEAGFQVVQTQPAGMEASATLEADQ